MGNAWIGLGRELLASRWSLLLLFTAAALMAQLDATMPISQLIGWFVVCGLGLVPLARMIAEMVEALASGLYELVVISIAGAVITNCLLILGISTWLSARNTATIRGGALDLFCAPAPGDERRQQPI